MYYQIIEIKQFTGRENVALIKRGEKNREYAVVRNLDMTEPFESDCQWDRTIDYFRADIEGLQKAVDIFRYKTEENYIPRARLEELATLFKDGLIEDGEEDALEYFDETCEMSDIEKEYFGIESEDEEDEED